MVVEGRAEAAAGELVMERRDPRPGRIFGAALDVGLLPNVDVVLIRDGALRRVATAGRRRGPASG